MTTFFGFAISDSMFTGKTLSFSREELDPTEAVSLLKEEKEHGLVVTCNHSHKATIDAMKSRFGLEVTIPAKPPSVSLKPGDSMYVMQVKGLPRLVDRHEYSEAEIAQASFTFSYWMVD